MQNRPRLIMLKRGYIVKTVKDLLHVTWFKRSRAGRGWKNRWSRTGKQSMEQIKWRRWVRGLQQSRAGGEKKNQNRNWEEDKAGCGRQLIANWGMNLEHREKLELASVANTRKEGTQGTMIIVNMVNLNENAGERPVCHAKDKEKHKDAGNLICLWQNSGFKSHHYYLQHTQANI